MTMRWAGLALAGLLAATPLLGAEPFYVDLLAEGTLASERGELDEAARKLRVACFGLLEEPPLLAECEIRLATVHAERGDRPAFLQRFARIAELERRFGAYEAAALPAAARDAFETFAVAWVRPEALAEVPAFGEALRRRTVERLATLPPAERRLELAQLAAAEPTNAAWPRELAHLAAADRNVVLAGEWIDRLLALAPDHAEGRCLRGRVAAMAGDCPQAVADLPRCAAPPADAQAAAEQLACWLAVGDLDGADALFASLPAAVQAARPVRRVARDLERARAASAPAGEPAADQATAGDGEQPSAAADDGEAQPAPVAPPDDELRRLRAALRRSRDYAAVAGVADQATGLADAHPDWLEAQRLAGEAAYRASRWDEAVRHFERAELDAAGEPPLLFYFAVCLYETGARAEAAAVLERALPGLEATPLVEAYRERILAGER